MADAKQAELLARINSTDDFYEVLGVERGADDAAIKKAYRRAALQLHPDKCQLDGAKEAFQKVSSAFGCLSEPDERAFYDRTGRERNQSAVGQHHGADPNEIFRTFFGEDFDFASAAAGGGGGVRFHSFGSNGMGGQSFVFNMGGGGMGGVPFRRVHRGRASGGAAEGASGGAAEGDSGGGSGGGGGGLERLLPWPLPALVRPVVGLIPPQLLVLLVVVLFFQCFAFVVRYAIYFMPVLWFAPSQLKLPGCFLIWGGIMSGHFG